VGSGATQLAIGDRVILSCVSSCGQCSNCRQGLYSHCLNPEGIAGIGWIFGYVIDGTQAEYVRVPFAENSVYKIPAGVTDAEGILLFRTSCRRASRSASSMARSSPATWSL